MYNIFYIYTYKYKNRQTRSRSHALNAYTNQDCISSLIGHTHKSKPQAIYIWAKIHKPHNVSSHTIGNLHICGDFEKLHNALCISVLSLFCNHIENVL